MCSITLIVEYTPDLILAWFSCFLHPSYLSGSICGLVKTQSLARGCKALQSHFHPSKGPWSVNTWIYPPLANLTPTLLPLQFLHQSSFPLARPHGMGHLTWNWSANASACTGNLGCESMAKRTRWFWWSHVWIGSASLCFSQCKCWLREHPLTLPRWRRVHRSRMTSHSCTGSSCPHLSCRLDLQHCWKCRQWCQWCCLGLKRG